MVKIIQIGKHLFIDAGQINSVRLCREVEGGKIFWYIEVACNGERKHSINCGLIETHAEAMLKDLVNQINTARNF